MSERKLCKLSSSKRVAKLLKMAKKVSFTKCGRGTYGYPDLVRLEKLRRKHNLLPSEICFVFKHSNMLIRANCGPNPNPELDNLKFEVKK